MRIDGNYVVLEIFFLVVFSGGINFLFWKFVVVFGVFNMLFYDFDLILFMGFFLDGKSYNFEFGVVYVF